jgi:hypothetical protein
MPSEGVDEMIERNDWKCPNCDSVNGPLTGDYCDICAADGEGRIKVEYLVPASRLRGAVDALAELVRLKDGPRDEAYRAAKDAAWDAARAVLARLGEQ